MRFTEAGIERLATAAKAVDIVHSGRAAERVIELLEDLAAVSAERDAMRAERDGGADCAVAAIQFALDTDYGLAFLRFWNEGEFDTIRREWPEAPKEVFAGADPLYVAARAEEFRKSSEKGQNSEKSGTGK